MKTTVADVVSKRMEKSKNAWAELPESAQRRLVESTVSEWARTTSMHGISKLTSSDSDDFPRRARRTVWSALLLFSLCLLMYQLGLLIAHYLERPVGSRTVEEDKKFADFPSVTLCPLNGLSMESIASAKQKLKEVAGRVFDIRNSTPSASPMPENSTCEEKWSKMVSNMPSKDNFMSGSVLIATSLLSDHLLLNVSVPLNRMLLDCAYYGRQCTPTDFIAFRNAIYGVCYSFNFNGVRKVSQAGASNSLQLTLALNQSDYTDNGCGDAGFRILVHQPGIYPFAESRGHHVGPGVSVQLGIQFRQIVNLGSPYGTCRDYTDRENRQLNWYVDSSIPNGSAVVNYSHEACTLTCQQRRYIEKCGCYSPYAFVPAASRSRLQPCEIRTALLNEKTRCLTPKQRMDIADACADECRFACNRTRYLTTTSFAQFPSESYLPRAMELAAASGFGADLAKAKADGELASFARSNFLRVSVFVESLKMVRLEQYPSYLLKDLLSDCGGQAGFWLGLSVLTVCELVELVTQLCGGTLLSNSRAKD